MNKACTKCKETKEELMFPKDRKCKSGISSWCKSCHQKLTREWHLKNRDKVRKIGLDYYYRNVEKVIKTTLECRKKNRLHYNAYRRYKHALFMKAVPKWADRLAIKEFYKSRPDGFEVDHIIPLQGDTVCGLHVLENLQYLTKRENCKKSNKWGHYSIR